jgi:hypothetical protein
MIGLYIFSALAFTGIVALVAVKIRWSMQDARKWAIINARNSALK